MRRNKHRVVLPDGTDVDVSVVNDDEVIVQLATKTGFVRVKRIDGKYAVRIFNTLRATVNSPVTAAGVSLALLNRTEIVVGDGDILHTEEPV